MTGRDWSQSGEQAFILEWADRHGPGRWLDIGAHDGQSASNSRALALAGWGGVAVEPSAGPFQKLAAMYADRDDVEVVQAAIVTAGPPLVGFYLTDDMVSTTEDRNMVTWSELVAFNPVTVAAVTPDQLLTVFPGPYDMVNIDTEGTSVELWHALRHRDVFAPGALVCVEAEDGGERWEIQEACVDGWARVAVTPQNVLLEKLL